MTLKRGLFALFAAGALLLAGCMSLDLSSALGRQAAQNSAGQSQNQQAAAPQKDTPPADTSAANQPPAKSSPGAGLAYQYQFGAFYSGFWSMGWFGYKDPNYKPGQGTIWKFTSTGRNASKPVTLERALLKANADSSQWWRFSMDTGQEPDPVRVPRWSRRDGSEGPLQGPRFRRRAGVRAQPGWSAAGGWTLDHAEDTAGNGQVPGRLTDSHGAGGNLQYRSLPVYR